MSKISDETIDSVYNELFASCEDFDAVCSYIQQLSGVDRHLCMCVWAMYEGKDEYDWHYRYIQKTTESKGN